MSMGKNRKGGKRMNTEQYALSELFERAKNDPAWETSEELREELVGGLVFQLFFSIT